MKTKILMMVIGLAFFSYACAQPESLYFSNNAHTSNFPSRAVKNLPERKWRFEMKLPGTTYVTIYGDRLFSNCSNKELTKGYQYAINKETGKQIWVDSIPGRLSMPIMGTETGYYGSKSANIYALDQKTGVEMWRFSDISDMMCVMPALINGRIFFGTHSREWRVLNAENGKLIKKDTTRAGICCIPSWNDKFVFFTDGSGRLYRQDINTLKDTVLYKSTAGSHVGPTLVGNTGIMTDVSCTVISVDLFSGKELWKHRTDGKLWRTPAIAKNICLVVTENCHIYAIDFFTGKPIWDLKKEGLNYTPASIAEDVAYVGCGDKKLYALDIYTGNELWSLELEDVPGQVFIESQILYFSAGKYVYAYK